MPTSQNRYCLRVLQPNLVVVDCDESVAVTIVIYVGVRDRESVNSKIALFTGTYRDTVRLLLLYY